MASRVRTPSMGVPKAWFTTSRASTAYYRGSSAKASLNQSSPTKPRFVRGRRRTSVWCFERRARCCSACGTGRVAACVISVAAWAPPTTSDAVSQAPPRPHCPPSSRPGAVSILVYLYILLICFALPLRSLYILCAQLVSTDVKHVISISVKRLRQPATANLATRPTPHPIASRRVTLTGAESM